jgi:SAM-dependent methyltransferase
VRRYYQSHWQNIHFADFAELSSTALADARFYQAFYQEFFKRYQRWDELPSEWLEQKRRCADLVLSRTAPGATMLSVGCGLGAMEHYLHAAHPDRALFIHEVATAAWAWVGQEFANDRKLVGHIPECLPVDVQFNLVFLSAVDYALDDDSLVSLLASLRPRLSACGGECLVISASFLHAPDGLAARAASLVRRGKGVAAAALDTVGLRSRGQFWGWLRTRDDYRAAMTRAGFHPLEDGFIDPQTKHLYWIAGRDAGHRA